MTRDTYVRVCHTCEVQLHEQCIVFEKVRAGELPDNNATALRGNCFCFDAQHQIGIHPALTGHFAQRTLPKRGQMREVDYDLEPFEQVGPLDKGKGGKYGKPAADLDDARAIQAEVDWRNETREMYRTGNFPQF